MIFVDSSSSALNDSIIDDGVSQLAITTPFTLSSTMWSRGTNCQEGFSNTTTSVHKTLERDRIGLVIQLVLFTIILVGNLSVIIALLSRNVKNQMQLFIINLAASDLIVALGGTLAQIIENITVQFFAPAPVCKLVKYMGSAITYSSSFALIILSIDRAEAVCRPLRVSSSRISGRTKARLMISVAWMAAGLCGTPALILSEKVSETCRFNFKRVNVQTYMVAIALTVFIIPACIIAACHVLMVVTIWRASKLQLSNASGDTGGRKSISSTGPSGDLVPRRSRLALTRNTIHGAASGNVLLQKTIGPPHHPKGGCISRAKVKTVKMTCVIVTVYIVCWCPFMVWNLVNTYVNFSATAPHLSKYTPHIQHLVTLNSAANPIIFWIFNAGSLKRNKNPTSITANTRALTNK
ncbi:Cardioacceleratory peptide receptor [Fasciola gigantica]|uniref:Cardioacceleratory peptide receptor n=1 Tax=Fasciola gigantica TaxID=46835 RepID=A0A504Y4R1_FASGI|nr:Cardioacceleratory peptide receptor [Fasciola gigantica]